MDFTKNYLQKKIKEFSEVALSQRLPDWEELPGIDLYMDQIIVLLNQYIGADEENAITQSMVNNYVKLKAVPAPVKKRYSKVHLAYLIVFCILKQVLSIANIQKIMPVDMSEAEVKEFYRCFVNNRKQAVEFTLKQTDEIVKSELKGIKNGEYNVLMKICNVANVFKTLTEYVLVEEVKPEDK